MVKSKWDKIWEREKKTSFHPIIIDVISKLNVKSALEVGAGSGADVAELSCRDIKTVFLDSSHIAVEKFRKRYPKIKAIQGDAFNLKFKDNSFDLVYTIGLYQYFNKKQRMQLLDELFRVSKKYVLIDVPQKFSPLLIVKNIMHIFDLWKFGNEKTFSYRELKNEIRLKINCIIISRYGRESLPTPRKWRALFYNMLCKGFIEDIWLAINKFFYFGFFNSFGIVFKKKQE